MEVLYLFSFMLSLTLTWYLTPRIAEAATRLGIVDRPDNILKKHEKSVPYLGALTIYIPLLFTVGLIYRFDQEVSALLLSSTIIITLGIIDDFGVVNPGVKILGQLIAVFVLIRGDIFIKLMFLPQWIGILLTALWIVGITNAFNIIDIKDGLATGISFIASVFLFIISVINANIMIAVFTITLAGSLLGFLRFNWTPASIYLGDAGSMFLGFTIGALAIKGSYTQNNDISALAPILILGVPIFEVVLVSIARLRKGMSPLKGSPDHFAHRLLKLGWPLPKVVITAYIASALLGGIALWVRGMSDIWLATIAISSVFFVGIVILFILVSIKMDDN